MMISQSKLEIKRIFSLEQRVAELENQLLRASASALEKRVKELEFSLKDNYVNSDSDSKEDYNSIGSGEEVIDKESDIIYERILKLVETMKLDCTRSINFKIPVHSGLPKFPTRQNSRSNLSKASTANIARPRTPSLAGASRPSTPSGIQRPSTPSPTSLTSSPSCIQRPSTPSGIQSPSSIQRPSAPSGIQIPSNTNNYIAPIYTNINNNNNSGSITTSPTKMPTPATKRPTLARASTSTQRHIYSIKAKYTWYNIAAINNNSSIHITYKDCNTSSYSNHA
ncbi:2661_t:CDS:2 [Entrophospora sp. SA101]|nr:2661_t:CDS:2 [Entrophospora sp. SA101]